MILENIILKFKDSLLLSAIETLLIATIILAVFVYPSYFGPTRLENFLLPLLLIVLVVKKLSFDNTIVILLIINMFIALISVYLNLNVNNGLMELFRWVKYILVVIFFSSLSKKEVGRIGLYIRLSFFIMVAVNILELLNPMGWGVEIAKYYSHHPLYYEGSDSFDKTFRLLGTAINPNNNALLWILMMLYFLIEYYYERKISSLLFPAACFIFIIFTQSRTGLATALFLGFLNLFFYKFRWQQFLFIGVLAFIGVFIAIWFKFTYIWQMFLYSPFKIHSLQLRFAIWRDMLNLYFQKPLFGWGHHNNFEALYPKVPDNEFLYVLLSQGGIGLFGIISIFIYTLYLFISKRNYHLYAFLPIFMVLSLLIIGITNLAFANIRIGLLFFAFWGMAYSIKKIT